MNIKTPKDLSNEEIGNLVKLIGEPLFSSLLKQIDKHILSNKKYANLSINSFINIVVCSLAVFDVNVLRCIQTWYKQDIGKPLDEEQLRLALMENINSQLGITSH